MPLNHKATAKHKTEIAMVTLAYIVVFAIVAGAAWYEFKHNQPVKIVREKSHCEKLMAHGYPKCCDNCKCGE